MNLRQLRRNLLVVMVASMVALNVPLLPAVAEEDKTPPVLTYLTFSTQTVDVTQDSQTVRVEARATDNLSGIQNISVNLYPPQGTNSNNLSVRWLSSGETWLGSIEFPKYIPDGQWRVSVMVDDKASNYSSMEGQTLEDNGFPGFVAVSSQYDSMPPTIQAVSISPDVVDVRTTPQVVEVRVSATDDLSGVTGGSMIFTPPAHGNPYISVSLAKVINAEGQEEWVGTATIPQYIRSGDWPANLTINDAVGNTRTMESPALAGGGYDHKLNVTSSPDLDPPVLERMSITPQDVDVSSSEQVANGEIKTHDGMAGVNSATVFLDPPSNTGAPVQATFSLDTNAAEEGVWTGVFRFPQYIESGDWKARLMIIDNVGNEVLMNSDQLAAAGYPHKVTVTNSPAQMAANQSLRLMDLLSVSTP